MKAVTFHEHGGPEKLIYEEVPFPKVGHEEILVRVKACALNHLDIWLRQGIPSYKIALPHISGCDVSGVIEKVGSAYAGHLTPGQSVFVMPGMSCGNCSECLVGKDNQCPDYQILGAQRNGGYAEYVACNISTALPIPKGIPLLDACTIPETFFTVWTNLFDQGALRKNESLLIHGGASGIGLTAISIAKALNIRCFATVGSSRKKEFIDKLNIERCINYKNEDFPVLRK